jgi:DNA polymerase-3 subunit alpha
LGIVILAPDANHSEAAFSVEAGKIRVGLGAIRNVGIQAMESLVDERQRGGAFKDLDDFLARIDAKQMGSRMLESLIKAGALDGLQEGPRAWALAELPERLGQAARVHEDRRVGQTSLFEGEALASPRPPRPLKVSEHESAKLAYEKEVLGFYVSGHPLERYASLLDWLAADPLSALKEKRDGAPVLLGGVLLSFKQQSTKRGEAFARAQLEDFEGLAELLLWPKVWEKARSWLKPESMVALRGRVDLSGDEVKVSVEEIVALEEAPQRFGKALRVELEAGAPAAAEALKAWIAAHPGKLPLLLQWQHGGESVVQRLGASHGVTAAPEALATLQALEGIKIRLET